MFHVSMPTRDEGAAWIRAQSCADAIPPLPGLVASAIRKAWNAPISTTGCSVLSKLATSGGVAELSERLLFRAFADGTDPRSYRHTPVHKQFDSRTCAALLAAFTLLERARKALGGGAIDVIEEAECEATFGMAIGGRFPRIGPGLGCLIPAARIAGQLALARGKPDTLAGYRMMCAAQDLLWDLDEEHRMFGCDHLQVAALLLTSCGISSGFAKDLHAALSTDFTVAVRGDAAPYRLVGVWAGALQAQVSMPDLPECPQFSLSEEEEARLGERIEQIRAFSTKTEEIEAPPLAATPKRLENIFGN